MLGKVIINTNHIVSFEGHGDAWSKIMTADGNIHDAEIPISRLTAWLTNGFKITDVASI